jgi:hypothetical protein
MSNSMISTYVILKQSFSFRLFSTEIAAVVRFFAAGNLDADY